SGLRHYDYDPYTWLTIHELDFATRFPARPTGSVRIPMGATWPERTVNRFLSYFGNSSYSFKDRYIVSGSIRWDGSNLFGVTTNQRGTALWPVGGSWEACNEKFFDVGWPPSLRLRLTYGSAGNIDKSQSHYPTIALTTNSQTGLTQAALTHPGNPALRWEKVSTFNVGLDLRALDNRIQGSIEYYNKFSKN